MKRLDVNDPFYQQQRVSHRINMFDGNMQKIELLRLELNCLSDSDPFLVNTCCEHVYQWFSDRNPHHIDLVLMFCRRAGIEPPPTAIQLATDVAIARLEGSPSGTSDRLLKEGIKSQALRIMINLKYTGADLAEAASKAASWIEHRYPEKKLFKASSLQKFYAEKYYRKGRYHETAEQDYFSNWDKFQGEEAKAGWREFREKQPLASDDSTGTRHRG